MTNSELTISFIAAFFIGYLAGQTKTDRAIKASAAPTAAPENPMGWLSGWAQI